MPSKPVLLIALLFASALASAVIGYAVYWSYASVLGDLGGQPALGDILSRVARLEYNASSPGDGNFTVVFTNNPVGGNATLEMRDSSGRTVALYRFTYNETGVVEASRVDPGTGEETPVDPRDLEEMLFNPVRFNVTQALGVSSLNVSPQPSLGPLLLPYTLSKELGVDWSSLRSPMASVRVGFTKVEWGGGELRGVAVTVEPRLPVQTTTWSRATVIAMTLARVNGVPAAVQATVVAGQDYVTLTLVSLEPAQG
ncbi:hypothetical protein [Stetteria hydrogenophila]